MFSTSQGSVGRNEGVSTFRNWGVSGTGICIQIFPTQALQFLVSETLLSAVANYHQETQLYDLLEDHSDLLDSTSWFLLVRTLPIASSEKILGSALDRIDTVHPQLYDTYKRWVQTLPERTGTDSYNNYTQAIVKRYEKVFGDELASKIKAKKESDYPTQVKEERPVIPFPVESTEQALAYIEKNEFDHQQKDRIKALMEQSTEEDKKLLIISLASRNIFRSSEEKNIWFNDLFEQGSDNWVYLKVAMFVYFADGWGHGLHEVEYLKDAYQVTPELTLTYLHEILGIYVSEGKGARSLTENLISALSQIGIQESSVKPLLDLIKRIVTRRLPDTYVARQNTAVYNGGLAPYLLDRVSKKFRRVSQPLPS